MTVSIRLAKTSDIPAITRIYAHAVEHGTASFELTPMARADAENAVRRGQRSAYVALTPGFGVV